GRNKDVRWLVYTWLAVEAEVECPVPDEDAVDVGQVLPDLADGSSNRDMVKSLQHDLGVVGLLRGGRFVDVEFLNVIVDYALDVEPDSALHGFTDGLRPNAPVAGEPACRT